MLQSLYQEVIIDHNRNPRHFRVLEPHDCRAVGHNQLCGDKLIVYARMAGDKIAEVSFIGEGCAISKASASMMTQIAKGLTLQEFEDLYQRFHHIITHHDAPLENLGELIALTGVREYPARVKCATLAWHTLNQALKGQTEGKTE